MKYNRLHWLPIICMTTVLISPHGDRAARADGVKLEDVQKQFRTPTMRVARPKQPPVVDGRLDDLAWQEVEAVTLHAAVGGWTSPSQKSEARVLADERAIYFAVQCFEASPETIRSAAQVQMGKVNTGDTVELFLDPGHHEKFGEYFHVAVNPAGEVYTARGLDSKAWSPNISARTAKDDDGWTVEVAIAMKDLGLEDGEIPKVWGLNVNRQRPELGVALPKSAQVSGHAHYWPMVRPLDEPEKYREGEYSGWAPTYSDYSYSDSRPFHFPKRLGHAVLEVGSRDVSPPPRLFEVIYKSDFDSGETGAMANGELSDESFRGAGKSYASKPQGKQTLYLTQPLADLQDAMLLMAFRLPKDGRLYHYARTPDGWKCGACRHEFFITPVAAAGRTADQSGRILFPTFDLYDTHADKMAWKSWGRLWKGPGPWSMVTGYLSEVSESAVIFPGTDWAVLHMRLGEFRRYAGRSPKAPEIPGQILVPRDLDYPGGLVFFPAPGPLLISDLVIFRGADVEPPAPPGNIQAKSVHEAIHLSWQRAEDNTLTAYYRVYAGDEMLVETDRLSAVVPHDWPQGRAMTIVAVDFYDNVSAPAEFSP